MKKVFQKNQLIITALALMIAVAGYFSYMNNHIDDGTAAETAANAGTDIMNGEYMRSRMKIHWLRKIFLRMKERGRNLRLLTERKLRMQDLAKIHTMRRIRI